MRSVSQIAKEKWPIDSTVSSCGRLLSGRNDWPNRHLTLIEILHDSALFDRKGICIQSTPSASLKRHDAMLPYAGIYSNWVAMKQGLH